MLRIEQNDPTLKALHVGDPDLSGWSEVGAFLSFVSTDFARLGEAIGKNTHLEKLHFMTLVS